MMTRPTPDPRSRGRGGRAVAAACGAAALVAAAAAAPAQEPPPATPAGQPVRVYVTTPPAPPAPPARPAVPLRYTTVAHWSSAAGKKVKAAFLGVTATPADAALRDQLKLPAGVGLVVAAVEPNSPAAAAGVRVHDVMTKVDDQWVVNTAQFGVVVRLHKADDQVTVSLVRQGQPQAVVAKLAEREVFVADADADGGEGWAPTAAAPAADGGWVQTGQVQLPAAGADPLRVLTATGAVSINMADDDDADVVIVVDGRTLKVRADAGKQRLTVTDKDGKQAFDGPIDTDDQRRAVPADVLAVLEKYKDQIAPAKADGPGGRRRVRIIENHR